MNNTEKQPLVLIAIATYDRAECIKEAIDSALDQTYKNIEIMIVDGSPNSKTKEVISRYPSEFPIRYIHEEENHTDYSKDRNEAGARNMGIRMSKGKYVAILDDDDIWRDKEKLAKQVKFLEDHSDYVVCGGGEIIIDEDNKQRIKKMFPEKDEDIRRAVFTTGAFVHSALLYRKDAWEKIGGYDEEVRFGVDGDLYMRLGRLGKLYNFQDYFISFVKGSQNESGRVKYFRRNAKNVIELIKRHRNNYPISNKAVLIAWLRYLSSFLPNFLRNFLKSIFFKS